VHVRGVVGMRVEFPNDISTHARTQGWSSVHVPCSTLHAYHPTSEVSQGHDRSYHQYTFYLCQIISLYYMNVF